MVCPVAYPAPPLSELEKNTDYVEAYLKAPEIKLTRLLRGMTGIEVNIYFRTDSTEIDWRSREQIANVAKAMWVYPMLSVSLGGHADSRGSEAYNTKLTQRRVAAVHKVFKDLLSRKYNPKRFNTHGYGEHIASYKQNDKEGMSFDRRVSILLLIQGK